MTNQSEKNPAQLWVLTQASENPRSVAARLLPDSVEAVSRRMYLELPNASDQQRTDWLIWFEDKYPVHFRPSRIKYRGDLSKLSAVQKLSAANGNPNPAPHYRKKP